jgi:HD-GYP domain-containing protein (c-di-GMP phosphodiesterase class II)
MNVATMRRMAGLRLAELIAPLAVASDDAAGLPRETALRTALIGVALGRACGLNGEGLRDTYYAGLLRHLGCSSTSHEETRLMGDEQELRTSFATVDSASPAQMLKNASAGFARGKSRLKRAGTVARFMARAPFEVPHIFAARCEAATQLGRRLLLGEGAVRALDETYERFDGKGLPNRHASESLSLVSRVLAVAETAAMFMRLPGGEALAGRILSERAGGQFDPAVVARFLDGTDTFVGPARADSLLGALLDAEPKPQRSMPEAHLREVALVLADFVDLKSTFTLGHSRRVAATAREAAAILGLPTSDQDRIELAGLLHDLGRISVSNAIWDKPGKLDVGEWEKVRAHTQVTERVLSVAEPWRALARLAASDHERLDGSGYPRGAVPANAGVAARILAAADMYQALVEPRPHRPAHSPEKAAAILAEEAAGGRVDRAAVGAVLEAVGQVRRVAAPNDLTARETEILQWLARGLVDKEIAERLGISHRTVHHHNQSIFGKIGVSTRGAAALFAIEKGLV